MGKSQAKLIDMLFEAGGKMPYVSENYKKQIFSNPAKFTNNLRLDLRGRQGTEYGAIRDTAGG